MPEQRTVRAYFSTSTGRRSPTMTLEVADTDERRAHGLMNRVQLPAHHGMLFPFPEPSQHGFWMKNTYLPLDIAWLDEQGVIIDAARMMPHDETMHRPFAPAKFAVELRMGTLAAYGTTLGDRLVRLKG